MSEGGSDPSLAKKWWHFHWLVRPARATGRAIGGAMTWLWPGRRVVGLMVFTLLLVAAVFPLHTRDHVMDIWRAIDRPPPDGLIVVDSPQVFTRERLVNDRLTEERWLGDQLSRTDALLEEGRFARPYLWMQETISRSIGEAAGEAPETPGKAEVGVERPAPVWEYEDALAYRNRIRYAKIATQLDDAHDIDSNTLYRMNFSISVLPNHNQDALAVVKIAVRESDRPAELARYYAQLMSEYLDAVQQTVDNVYRDRVRTIEQGQSFAPTENNQVDHFVRHQIQMLIPRLRSSGANAFSRQEAEGFLNASLGQLTEARKSFDDRQNQAVAGSLMASLGEGASPQDRQTLLGRYFSLCHSRGTPVNASEVFPSSMDSGLMTNLPLPCSTRPRNWPLVSRFQVITALRAIAAQLYGLKDYSLPMDRKGLFRAEIEASGGKERFAHPCATGAGVELEAVMDAVSYIFYASTGKGGEGARNGQSAPPQGPQRVKPFVHDCPAFAQAVRAVRRDFASDGPGTVPSTRIAVADFVRRTMEIMESKRLNRELRLGDFFSFDLASCSPQDCSIYVSYTRNVRKQLRDRRQGLRFLMHKFYEELNCGARAQTYALTPKKDTSYLGLQQFSRATLALLSQNEATGPVKASSERSQSGQVEQPTIIGLGDWGRKHFSPAARSGCRLSEDKRYRHFFPGGAGKFEFTDQLRAAVGEFFVMQRSVIPITTHFGWMILPRREAATESGQEAQVDDSVLVSALVSLPSWWGRVRVDVDTCWMEREQVSGILESEDLCETPTADGVRKQQHVLYVKLPGTADEVLSRMAFFPLKAPYLNDDMAQTNVVEVGREGVVTLVGSRLWKNPRVRLGHQWASSVEVLPNMRGLVARFDCIEPDPGTTGVTGAQAGQQAGAPQRNRPVRIWTSEGTTTPLSVIVRSFQPRDAQTGGEDRPCWVASAKAGE